MKRLNKFLKIAILGLLSLVAVDGAAQSATDGTKKVTYTFKGSVLDNSALLSGLFGRKQQLYLKSSGSKPAGVQDPDINCTTDGHVPPVGSSRDGGDFQHFDKHLLGGLSTLYVVEENEHAVVRFHNFKYEVARILWNRRSQHALMTSKGGSWIEDFKGNESDSYIDYGDEDGIVNSPDYSTGGEIFYHNRDFVKFSETTPYKRYAGISTLNINVSSKRSYQGIAIQDFEIYYFTPTPLIAYVDNGDGTYTIDVTIGKEQHVGAFTKNDFALEYNHSLLEEVSSNVTVEGGTTIHGIYNLRKKAGAQGTATVYAKIMNNGEVAGKSQTSLKLELSPKKGFTFEGVKFWEKSGGQWMDAKKWGDDTNCSTLSLASTAGYLNESNTQSKSKTLVEMNGTRLRQAREGVVAVSYNIDVPAYSILTRKIQFSTTVSKNISVAGIGENVSIEIREFDKLDNNISFNNNGEENYNKVLWNQTDGDNKTASTSNTGDNVHCSWPMSNTADERDVANPVYNVSKSFIKYFTLAGNDMRSQSDVFRRTSQPQWKFEYVPFTGTTDYDFVFDYYAYITYDLDGGTGISTTGPIIHKTKSQNNTDPANGGVPAKILPLEDSELSSLPGDMLLTYTGLTKTTTDPSGRTINWKFIGWRDATDGEYYYPGDKFNPFDKSGECGKGPRTLVAQWEEIPAIIGVTFLADGGNVGGTGENYVSKRVTYNHQGWYIDDSHDESNFNAPTATKVGYDFLGYTDMTGLQQFNDAGDKDAAASTYGIYDNLGALQAGKATNYITSSKWTSADDVVFYAMFKQKSAGEIASITHTLTLDANYTGAAEIALTMMTGSQDNNNLVSHTPTRPVEPANASTIDHYMFAGWYTHPSSGDMVYAADGSAVKLVSVTPANLDVYPPVPEKSIYEAYNSTYWNNDATYKYDNDVKLYAHWVAVPKGDELVITFDEGSNSDINTATWNISSNTSMETPTYEAVEYKNVIVKRKLKLDQWNTVCFPCDIYKSQCEKMFDAVKVLTSIEVENEDVMMKFSDSKSITAGVPYFVKMKSSPVNTSNLITYVDGADKGTLTIWDVETGKTASSAVAADGLGNSVTMIGNFVTKYHLDAGLVYLQDDKFYVSQNEYLVSGVNKKVYGNLRGFRCYFDVDVSSTPVKSLSLHLDLEGYDGWSGEDAIEDINAEGVYSAGGGDIYDLSGRQLVGKPQRGLYIVNGRKYISK